MHILGELEAWRERRKELVREAEEGRMARRLRSVRPKRTPRFEGRLFAGVRAYLARRKEPAEC